MAHPFAYDRLAWLSPLEKPHSRGVGLSGSTTREYDVAEVSIGEFARRSRLSVKALRLYDELGVLIPARVDEASGYRYYDVAQLD